MRAGLRRGTSMPAGAHEQPPPTHCGPPPPEHQPWCRGTGRMPGLRGSGVCRARSPVPATRCRPIHSDVPHPRHAAAREPRSPAGMAEPHSGRTSRATATHWRRRQTGQFGRRQAIRIIHPEFEQARRKVRQGQWYATISADLGGEISHMLLMVCAEALQRLTLIRTAQPRDRHRIAGQRVEFQLQKVGQIGQQGSAVLRGGGRTRFAHFALSFSSVPSASVGAGNQL